MSQPTIKIYKVVQSIDGKPSYLYFADSALASVTSKIFARAGETAEQFGLAAFEADPTAVNLQAFLSGGGILTGPVEIK